MSDDLKQMRDVYGWVSSMLDRTDISELANHEMVCVSKSRLLEIRATLDRLIAEPSGDVAADVPILTGDIKVGVTTFRKGVKLSTVQSCIDSHINNLPRISGDINILEDLAKNMRGGSVEFYAHPPQPDVSELLGVLKDLYDAVQSGGYPHSAMIRTKLVLDRAEQKGGC